VGKKSSYTHTVHTQNQFKFTQHNGSCFHSTFPIVVDAGMNIRALYSVVNDVRPHEERLENEAESPTFFFNEVLDVGMYQHYCSCHILFKGFFSVMNVPSVAETAI
jgi:hypothetical protein